MRIEDWIDQQYATSPPHSIMDKIIEYQNIKNAAYNSPNDTGAYGAYFYYAWWQYAMASLDVLRERIAFALSEILVISKFSTFSDEGYAFGAFYDILLENAFGNYRDLLEFTAGIMGLVGVSSHNIIC